MTRRLCYALAFGPDTETGPAKAGLYPQEWVRLKPDSTGTNGSG